MRKDGGVRRAFDASCGGISLNNEKVRAAFNVRETETARWFDWPVLVAAGVRCA